MYNIMNLPIILLLLTVGHLLVNIFKLKHEEKTIGALDSLIEYGLDLYEDLENDEFDCFKNVATKLVNECDIIQFENIDHAISLTLCKLKKAQKTIPKPCLPLLKDDVDGRDKYVHNCLNEIYRGYPEIEDIYNKSFLELSTMCLSIHYPTEKNIIERLYYMIDFSFIENYNILTRQRGFLITWRDETLPVKKLNEKDIQEIQDTFQALVLFQYKIELSMNDFYELMRDHVKETQRLLKMGMISQKMRYDILKIVGRGLKKLDGYIQEMVTTQTKATRIWFHFREVENKLLNNLSKSEKDLNTSFNQILNNTSKGIISYINQDK